MIEFRQVTKKYIRQTALEDASFTIEKGKVIGVVGANGSGKSTTLKLLAGLIHPTNGEVTVDGTNVDRTRTDKVAYLSELDTFYSFYTVKETVAFYSTQFEDFDLEKAEEMLKFMKLDPDKKVKELSKGNRGRLKIVLVLSRKAPVILMDEPLSGLDPMVRDSIVKGLLSFIDMEKQTVVITTHEINEIEPLLDSIIAIDQGRILKVADVETIRMEENLSIVEWMKKVYE